MNSIDRKSGTFFFHQELKTGRYYPNDSFSFHKSVTGHENCNHSLLSRSVSSVANHYVIIYDNYSKNILSRRNKHIFAPQHTWTIASAYTYTPTGTKLHVENMLIKPTQIS